LSRPDYGPLARTLHRLALGSRLVGQTSFDLEEMTSRSAEQLDIIQPVFICGLARSGSTILLNALHQTGSFRSLTYRDMPFVLMSGMWRKLSAGSRIQREQRERAHGDRIMVDYDSPEAFEEVFWRVFYGDKYIFEDQIVCHTPPKSVRKNFHRFVGHVLKSREHESQARYLSKNNNNLLRMPTLSRVFPDAVIIIPFRDPVQQALSLLKQHQLFNKMHDSDRFSMEYMNWLGHFEFGLGHKHYDYGYPNNPFSPLDLDYWLQGWLDSYNFALESAPDDAIFLGYEQLCDAPRAVFTKLAPLISLEADATIAASYYKSGEKHIVDTPRNELTEKCEQTYTKLGSHHRALLSAG
jgi:hypothetical protein